MTSMTTDIRPVRKPCSVALSAAQAAQEAVAPDTVILFGSRARGDYRPDSDIDLLVIHHHYPQVVASGLASKAARHYLKSLPATIPVNSMAISRETFDYARRAANHVAAQALRDGVIMTREKLDYTPDWEEEEPLNWPDVKERLQAAYDWLENFDIMVEDPRCTQRVYGFLAQQAVENALKGWISAADLKYDKVHDIEEIVTVLLLDPAEANTDAADHLRHFLNYTRYEYPEAPGETRNWLTQYAVAYRYSGAAFQMDDQDRNVFRQEINDAVQCFVRRAQELTGTTDQDLR